MRTSKLFLVAGLLAFNNQTDRLNGCPHGDTKQEIVEKSIEKFEKKSQFSDAEKKHYVTMLFIYSGGKPFREQPFQPVLTTKWWSFPYLNKFYHNIKNGHAWGLHNIENFPIEQKAASAYKYFSSIDGIRWYLQNKIDSEQKHTDLFRQAAQEKPEVAEKCLEFAQIHEQEKTRLQTLLANFEKIAQRKEKNEDTK